MKLKSFNTVFFVVLIMALMTVNIFAEVNTQELENNTSMDIRERLEDESINILKEGFVKFYDTEGNEITEPTINATLKVRFDLALSNQYTGLIKAGDFYEFKLPNVFSIHKEVDKPLGEYGHFTVDKDANVKIIFNENIELNSKVSGYLEFTSFLNEDVITHPGQYEVVMPVENETVFDINVKPTSETTAIEKHGRFDRDRNPGGAVWDIYVNKSYETLTNPVIEDMMPDGLTVESVEVFQPTLNHAGEIETIGEAISSENYSVDGQSVSFSGDISTPYLIRYHTKINDDIKPNDGGNLDFFNEATMKADNLDKINAGTTIVANYGTLLKKLSPSYDSSTQTFTWNIQYNYGEKTLAKGMLFDTFDSNLQYVEDSLVIKSMKNEAVDVKYTVVNENNTLKIVFDETISEAYNISYQTKVKDDVLITEAMSFKNTVVSEDKTSESTGTAVPRLIDKSAGAVNYTDKKIPWSINVNNNNYELNNYSITDTYISGGLTMDQSTFKIKNVTKNVFLDESDYSLKIMSNQNKETGFTLTLLNDYVSTHDQFKISFETYYDINELNEGFDNVFKNHVQLKWTDKDGKEHTHDGEAISEVNAFTVHNGRKIGSYNAITKEIQWQVDMNYNSEVITEGKLEDNIQEGQVFLNDSLEIHTYEVLSNGVIVLKDKLKLKDFDIDYPSDGNQQTLTVVLPDSNDVKYSVIYRTSVASEAIQKEYKNEAVFSNDQFKRLLKASVTITNGNKFVSKYGSQDGDIAKWQVNINESQSIIRDAEIHDFPCLGQILLEDSFNVYPVIVSENESYEIDYDHPLQRDLDYDLVINVEESGKQNFVLRFKKDIEHTYILQYSSQINLNANHTELSNTVKFKGNEVTYETEDGPSRIVVDLEEAGGDAVGEKGSFKLRKVDQKGRPLEGVEFELYNRLERKVGSRITNELGEIEFSNLIYSDYSLYETKALKGYVISPELYNGTSVLVDDTSSQEENIIVLENRMNELIIHKVDENNSALSGARFELVKLTDGSPLIVSSDFEVSESGKIFYGLQAGDYELREKVAPQGYVLNTQVHSFTISEDENQQELDLALNIVNYQGSVRLSKVDSENNRLDGVIFDLYDAEHTLVADSLVTDELGQITLDYLYPGDYYFKEVSTVKGNVVNESPLHFTIAEKSLGKPEIVDISATNSKGSVQFKKVSEQNNSLSGVLFTLFNENDEEVISLRSNSEGIVRVDQLTPGNYYFKEIEALDSYIRNTQSIDFTIPEKTLSEEVLIELDDFVNYRGKLEISKVNENKQVLKEARFKLYDDKGNVVKKFTTVDGKYTVEYLSPGIYTIEEIEAPLGYVLSDELMTIEIVEHHEGRYDGITLEVINTEEQPIIGNTPSSNPKTGIKDTTMILGIILIISLLGLIVLNKTKRKKI